MAAYDEIGDDPQTQSAVDKIQRTIRVSQSQNEIRTNRPAQVKCMLDSAKNNLHVFQYAGSIVTSLLLCLRICVWIWGLSYISLPLNLLRAMLAVINSYLLPCSFLPAQRLCCLSLRPLVLESDSGSWGGRALGLHPICCVRWYIRQWWVILLSYRPRLIRIKFVIVYY